MIIKKYPAPPIETAASRYDRDWLNIPDLDTAGQDDYRRDRTLLSQAEERKSRRYVDDGVSAVTGGSPVFGPDDNGGGTPVDPTNWTTVWIDGFEGPELNSRWSVMDGVATLPPLKTESRLLQIAEFVPVGSGDVEMTINVDPTGSEAIYFGFFGSYHVSPQRIGSGTQFYLIVEEEELLVPAPTLDYDSINKISFRMKDGTGTIYINDALIEGISIITNWADSVDLYPYIGIGRNASVTSASLKVLNNGGGTPEEPSDPEVPEEPEVP